MPDRSGHDGLNNTGKNVVCPEHGNEQKAQDESIGARKPWHRLAAVTETVVGTDESKAPYYAPEEGKDEHNEADKEGVGDASDTGERCAQVTSPKRH